MPETEEIKLSSAVNPFRDEPNHKFNNYSDKELKAFLGVGGVQRRKRAESEVRKTLLRGTVSE